nr:hypothetical protein [Tanacetum cinerariifolium]
MFTVYPQYGLSLDSKDLDQVLAFVHEFERLDLMKPGNKVFSITYLVAYALTSSHHSIDYIKKEYIKIDDLFNEIGSVEGSKFAAIKLIDESWAIDIAKNKRLIGEEPSRSSVHIKRNRLHIGETSSDIRQSMNDECEQQFKENPQDFKKYLPKQFFNTITDQRMEEPTTESDSEEEQTPKIEKINRVKTERGETSNKKRSYEFRMPLHKGIPNKNREHLQWIEAYLMKIPIISDQTIQRWKNEGNTISKNSLAFATRLAKEEIAKICDNRYKQKKLKSLSKRCCENIIDMENLEIGNLKFKGLKEYRLHCYIDTGASLAS